VVTNSQQILIPMQVNLPASTPGNYTLMNNSTNPGVSLIINSITHNGANTRATTFILDGTNSNSINIVTNLSEGPGNGTGGITKQGSCTWIIAGPGRPSISIREPWWSGIPVRSARSWSQRW
jgi:hypothetical protein